MTEVKSGDVVRVHYTGRLEDGSEFGSSHGGDPLELRVGAGHVIPGLDRRLDGLTVGEQETLTVPVEEAYGERDEREVHVLPRSALPPSIDLSVGAPLQATTQEGRQVELVVTDFDDEQVTVDANHPLAGHDLTFDIQVVEIIGREGASLM